jgi:hypothetical protein
MASPVADAALRFRAQLLARDARRVAEMVQAYGAVWSSINSRLVDLERALQEGESELALMRRLRELQAQVERELTSYGAYADQQLLAGVREGLGMSSAHAQGLVQEGYGPMGGAVIRTSWNRLPVEALETLVGMLSDTSPLRHRMEERLGAAVAQSVGETLVTGLAQGWGPRRTQQVLRSVLGQGLEWSLSATRTATIRAYREGMRANYAANSALVKAWRWTAAFSARTCMSCIAQDGRVYPLNEPLRDHHNGRCTATPVLATYRELGIPMDGPEQTRPTAREWFEGLPEAEQRKMMGDAAWEEWRRGKFALADYSRPYQDEVYGEMFRQAALKELLAKVA